MSGHSGVDAVAGVSATRGVEKARSEVPVKRVRLPSGSTTQTSGVPSPPMTSDGWRALASAGVGADQVRPSSDERLANRLAPCAKITATLPSGMRATDGVEPGNRSWSAKKLVPSPRALQTWATPSAPVCSK